MSLSLYHIKKKFHYERVSTSTLHERKMRHRVLPETLESYLKGQSEVGRQKWMIGLQLRSKELFLKARLENACKKKTKLFVGKPV